MGCKRGQPVTVTDATQAENGDWLVGNPTGPQLASALWIGSVGLLILGLQPVLLGALYTEGHVTGDELALVATAEMIAIAIGSGVEIGRASCRERVESEVGGGSCYRTG